MQSQNKHLYNFIYHSSHKVHTPNVILQIKCLIGCRHMIVWGRVCPLVWWSASKKAWIKWYTNYISSLPVGQPSLHACYKHSPLVCISSISSLIHLFRCWISDSYSQLPSSPWWFHLVISSNSLKLLSSLHSGYENQKVRVECTYHPHLSSVIPRGKKSSLGMLSYKLSGSGLAYLCSCIGNLVEG